MGFGPLMMDLAAVRDGLESPLVAAFTHVVGVLGGAVEADLVVLRLVNVATTPHTRLAAAPRLRLPAAGKAALKRWVDADHPLDQVVTNRFPAGHVCRHDDLNAQATGGASGACFDGLRPEVEVVDGIVTVLPLADHAHAMLMLARCRPGEKFDDHLLTPLRELQPNIARLLLAAYRNQFGLNGSPLTHALPPNLTVAQLVARLSSTEQQVLHYVRSNATEPEIAKALSRSRHTIHVHVKNIYRKLGVSSRRQLHALLASG